jgi:hypothetical protein
MQKIIFLVLTVVIFLGCGSSGDKKQSISTFGKITNHKNIITTLFWVGEVGAEDNGHISNVPSAWNDNWSGHFGGVDDPNDRDGFFPKAFTPKENPFYFALPYNDFTSFYKRKESAKNIPWFDESKRGVSICKNRWIKITKDGVSAYAQWEDVGPFGEDDFDYVFGTAKPKNSKKSKAGLDISPSVRDYLGLKDVDRTDWEFVEFSQVPEGPWKQIVNY